MLGLVGAVGGGGAGNARSLLGRETEERSLGQLLLGVDACEEASDRALVPDLPRRDTGRGPAQGEEHVRERVSTRQGA